MGVATLVSQVKILDSGSKMLTRILSTNNRWSCQLLSHMQWWSNCLVQRLQRRQCLLETSTRACGNVRTPEPRR